MRQLTQRRPAIAVAAERWPRRQSPGPAALRRAGGAAAVGARWTQFRRSSRAAASPSRSPQGQRHTNCSSNGGGGSGSDGGGRGGRGWGSGGSDSGGDPWHETPRVLLLFVAAAAGSAAVLSVAAPSQALLGGQPSSSSTSSSGGSAAAGVSIIVPVLNEAAAIQQTLYYLQHQLRPPPAEIIVVDGGSVDGTQRLAKRTRGVRLLASGRGRARQMNAGAAAAKGAILLFVHCDSQPPQQAVAVAQRTLADARVVLGGFRTAIECPGRRLHLLTANHWAKTYYGPLLFRPLSFFRGLRCLFGDQSLFCRKADFQRMGGFDERLPIMEDADLCIRLHMAGPAGLPGRRGRVVQLNSLVNRTSGRRLAPWGNLWATTVHLTLSANWLFGASPERMHRLYRELYADSYR